MDERAKRGVEEDIPAEVGEFLVNTLERHVWMCGMGGGRARCDVERLGALLDLRLSALCGWKGAESE
jgi:hypothetical protein